MVISLCSLLYPDVNLTKQWLCHPSTFNFTISFYCNQKFTLKRLTQCSVGSKLRIPLVLGKDRKYKKFAPFSERLRPRACSLWCRMAEKLAAAARRPRPSQGSHEISTFPPGPSETLSVYYGLASLRNLDLRGWKLAKSSLDSGWWKNTPLFHPLPTSNISNILKWRLLLWDDGMERQSPDQLERASKFRLSREEGWNINTQFENTLADQY